MLIVNYLSIYFSDAWDYIQKTRNQIDDLKHRVVQTQENAQQIRLIMTTWSKTPLFERKDGKKDTLLGLDDREDRCSKRYAEITDAGKQILSLLEVSKKRILKHVSCKIIDQDDKTSVIIIICS